MALWRLPADRTLAIPWICQDASPKQNIKPAAARSAPRLRRVDRQRGGELWSSIDGSPFSAMNCPAREVVAQEASGCCRKSRWRYQTGIAAQIQASPLVQSRAL